MANQLGFRSEYFGDGRLGSGVELFEIIDIGAREPAEEKRVISPGVTGSGIGQGKGGQVVSNGPFQRPLKTDRKARLFHFLGESLNILLLGRSVFFVQNAPIIACYDSRPATDPVDQTVAGRPIADSAAQAWVQVGIQSADLGADIRQTLSFLPGQVPESGIRREDGLVMVQAELNEIGIAR